MKRSLKNNGQTIADFSDVSPAFAAVKVIAGWPLTIVRRLRATQPARPSPFFSVVSRSRVASGPEAKRQFSVSVSAWYRNRVQSLQGTRFVSFDEMSAIVSAT